MDSLLKTWISESESWQSFMDFQLPEESRANYPFLERVDDFYLSLMHRCLLILKQDDLVQHSEELLSIAKGLEIYSLENKRDKFTGVNYSNNILFASAFYYLSDYSASAWILSRIFPHDNYITEIDAFISSFLRRDLKYKTEFTDFLHEFLETGNFKILEELFKHIEELTENAFNENANEYISFILAKVILKKFSTENIWYDLLQYNNDAEYWKPIVSKYIKKKVPVWSFFPSQKEAINKGVLSDETYTLQMPTSSGKTSISEIIIYNEIKSKRTDKILYLAPFRALASELKTSLAINLAALGIKSKTIYGGNIPTVEERNSIEDVNLLIATPEKFMAIENIFPDIHKEFNTIICDEGHLLDDSSRGLSYELLLSRLKEDRTHKKKFVFISAIIPNIDIINSWLGGNEDTLVSSKYRPTELEFAFLKKMSGRTLGYYLDINPTQRRPKNYQLYRYLYADELKIKNLIANRNSSISSKKAISAAVAIKATNSGTVALFAPHKRGHSGVEGLAEEVLNQLEWKANSTLIDHTPNGILDSLVEYFTKLFGQGYLLVKSLKFGFIYHHGDFPQGVREIVEDSLRKGQIKLVICTNTLAEGVNLPIKTIVIHSTKRFDLSSNSWQQIKIRDLKNLVGRAGRAGKETKGLVIVPHSSDFDRIENLINESKIEPVKGQLYNIIHLITDALKKQSLQLTSDMLDELDDYFQSLLDSIDLSMIDLLAEEVNKESLKEMIQELISQTLSYHQSDENERDTLETIFSLRAEKIIPFIVSGEFKNLKSSGTSLRLYDDIKVNVDFENEIWNEPFSILDDIWVDYILDGCLFKLNNFNAALESFNEINKCNLSADSIKLSIKLWMTGSWFHEIADSLGLEIFQVLRLINTFLSYNVQSVLSSIIRIKDIVEDDFVMPELITNWPSMLQYGISKQLELDLFEMGLIDRVAVLCISDTLTSLGFEYIDYKNLKYYLINNQEAILVDLPKDTPQISIRKIERFFRISKI